jgi:hypothetical protein
MMVYFGGGRKITFRFKRAIAATGHYRAAMVVVAGT